MKLYYDTIVIGGGAAGMAAAISSAEHGKKTLLLEKSDRLGRKISASGNGRCNLMNTNPPKYYGDTIFANKVVRYCNYKDLISFFNRYGLLVKEKDEGRVYPVTMRSVSVLNTLQNALKMNHVDVLYKIYITEITKAEHFFCCKSYSGDEYVSDALIICTGGAAQKKLGGSTDGYHYLQSLHHHLEPVFPSLVPVITDPKSISGLAGIRIYCKISLKDGFKTIHQEEGEVLFTEYGLSGICVMQCSRFVNKTKLYFELDFLSSIFETQNKAFREITDRRDRFGSLSPIMLLEGILLPKLAFAVLKQAGIPLRGETANSLNDEDLQKIISTAYHYKVEAIDTKSLEDAQVTAGGIRCDEFNPQTLESKKINGLFAAGEILNVDGDCGGFNLMFAFASGIIAGGFRKEESNIAEDAE